MNSKPAKSMKAVRQRLHRRIRKKISGTAERPRLSVCFTGQHIVAQLIDDVSGTTLVGVETKEKDLLAKKLRPNVAGATEVGKLLAERAKSKKIEDVVFDRGGFRYHGKVKALAEAVREGGLKF
ncbi:MAG: 50S ribosomal protein L18 [Verrucomicrobiota bacterium]